MQYTTRAKREGRVRRRQTLTSPGGPDTADSVFLTDKVHITTTLRPVGGGGGGGGGGTRSPQARDPCQGAAHPVRKALQGGWV